MYCGKPNVLEQKGEEVVMGLKEHGSWESLGRELVLRDANRDKDSLGRREEKKNMQIILFNCRTRQGKGKQSKEGKGDLREKMCKRIDPKLFDKGIFLISHDKRCSRVIKELKQNMSMAAVLFSLDL